MNLIVVDKCTNYCKYCFASTEMSKSTAKAFLHEKHFDFLKQFIYNSGSDFELNIIGGEPFLYTHLEALVQELLTIPNLAKICIFTGGIASPKVIKKILRFDKTKINFMFNMNEKKDYHTEKEYNLVLDNFDLIISNGFKAIFGYNIYETDFDYTEILNLCDKYGTSVLRWTVAFPELKPSALTVTLPTQDYKFISTRVADFLEDAYLLGINANLDCPLPKCFFSNEQLGRIALTQPHTLNSIRACGPVIDVSPDLDVFRCYALSDLKRTKLTDFTNFQECVEYYEKHVDDLYNMPETFVYCATCEFALNKTCYGGCIAHSPNAVGTRTPKENIIKLMYEKLQTEPNEVEVIFDIHRYELRSNAFANYIMSFVEESKGNIEYSKSYARKSIILSTTLQSTNLFTERFNTLTKLHQLT